MTPLYLSILIPSIPSRRDGLFRLYDRLAYQAHIAGVDNNVEILAFLDNKRRSVGYKRDGLVQLARGQFCAFVDDDDIPRDTYVDEIVRAIERNLSADVIVFQQDVTINGGNPFRVTFGLEHKNEEAHQVNGQWVDITRKPFHTCAWRTSLAQSERFADTSYGEDWDWAKRLCAKAKSQARIDNVLLRYVFDQRVTEASTENPILETGQ